MKTILILFFLFLCSSVDAQEYDRWIYVGTTVDDEDFYFDIETVSINKNIYGSKLSSEVWVKYTSPYNKKWKTIIQKWKIYCKESSAEILHNTVYLRSGKIESNDFSKNPDKVTIIPSSLADEMFNYLCKE